MSSARGFEELKKYVNNLIQNKYKVKRTKTSRPLCLYQMFFRWRHFRRNNVMGDFSSLTSNLGKTMKTTDVSYTTFRSARQRFSIFWYWRFRQRLQRFKGFFEPEMFVIFLKVVFRKTFANDIMAFFRKYVSKDHILCVTPTSLKSPRLPSATSQDAGLNRETFVSVMLLWFRFNYSSCFMYIKCLYIYTCFIHV